MWTRSSSSRSTGDGGKTGSSLSASADIVSLCSELSFGRQTDDQNNTTPGPTLEAWLRARERRGTPPGSQEAELRARLGVATALARALCECHAAGVAHRRLSPSNVIVEVEASRGGHGVVHLINLGRKDGCDAAARRLDLEQLGRVFQRLFGGGNEALFEERTGMAERSDSDDEYGDNRSRKKRGKSSRAIEGIPLYLTAMITALLRQRGDSGNGDDGRHHGETYESVEAVLSDLKVAAQKFETLLARSFDRREASLLNRLPIPSSAFYGRRTELAVLESSLDAACITGQPTLTLVAGPAGACQMFTFQTRPTMLPLRSRVEFATAGIGKSALVRQAEATVGRRRGHLIRSKFDRSDCSRPDAVLYGALDAFFDAAPTGTGPVDAEARAGVRRRIASAFGCGAARAAPDAVAPAPPVDPSCLQDLVHCMPNLGRFLGDCFPRGGHEPARVSQERLLQRSKYLLCKLIAAMADQSSPLVLGESICTCSHQMCKPAARGLQLEGKRKVRRRHSSMMALYLQNQVVLIEILSMRVDSNVCSNFLPQVGLYRLLVLDPALNFLNCLEIY